MMEENSSKSCDSISFKKYSKKFLNDSSYERGTVCWNVDADEDGIFANLHFSDCHNAVSLTFTPSGGYYTDVEYFKETFQERMDKLEVVVSSVLDMKSAMLECYPLVLKAIEDRIELEASKKNEVPSEV